MARQTHSKVLTVMFIDVVNYTKITTQLNKVEFNKFHDAFDAIVGKVCKQQGGHIVKKIGDAFLITFVYSLNAFHCARELQNSFETFNSQYKLKAPLKIRVAMHTGECLIRDNDVYGTAVNLASRLEKFASAGQIVFSESTRLTVNSQDIPPFKFLGKKRVKGLKHPVRVFRLKALYIKKKRKKKRRRRSSGAFIRLVQLIFVIAFFVFLYYVIKGA